MKSALVFLRAPLLVVALFAGLTILMTWPQARVFGTQAYPHQDVYFNMWRLEWIAHAMVSRSDHVFDGNIFYPERRTLAYSDAMPVEGVLAAPMIWAGVRPVFVHNVMMLGAIALSGAAMFALVLYLTGSRGAALLAGIVFAFAPYRFEHLMHMELQWTMWMPLAFLAFHRTLDTGEFKMGVLTGLLVALQMLSSIYYGIFLATVLAIVGPLLLMFDRRVTLRRALMPLMAGALLAVLISGAYAIPYIQARQRVGERPQDQVMQFSARPSSYMVATPNNWLYGNFLEGRGRGERRLFPGLLVIALAICGLLLKPVSARILIYLISLVLAFEASLGLRGYVYRVLFDYVPVYHGLRAPARLGIFVVMFLGVLGAYGYQHIVESRGVRTRRILVAVFATILLAEYSVTMELMDYPNQPPSLYRYLKSLPKGVVAEFPVPRVNSLPGPDAEHSYFSIFHWFPIVNGYSGSYPPTYLSRLENLQHFPDATAMKRLRNDGVRYIIVHEGGYTPDAGGTVLRELVATGQVGVAGTFEDGSGQRAHLFILR
jgi:hypothetical protein